MIGRMRRIYVIVGVVTLVVSAIVGLFALNQANQEQIELTSRLQSRSQVLAESLAESIESSYNARATTIQRVIDRFASNERLAGLGVFDNRGTAIAVSQDLPLPENGSFITTVMDSDEAAGDFVSRGDVSYYVHVIPLHEDGRVSGALAVAQNATYIDDRIRQIWWNGLIRLLLQIVVFAAAIFVLVRWVFMRSVSNLAASVQVARKNGAGDGAIRSDTFLEPLAGEISKVTASLRAARSAASEEARMRMEKIETPWTAERLGEFIKAHFKDRSIFVLSNREPYVHKHGKNGAEWTVPPGGVVTALEPVMEASGGMWIAHGGGSADKETADADGKLPVPPDEPSYTLKRIWLEEKDMQGYYNGFSNEALWPLCQMAHVRPIFRAEDWASYRKVNAAFVKALLDEVRHIDRPIVLVQDYHLALAPALIKRARPDAQGAIFWHIPWPSAAQFSICPWRCEILEGMLGADLVGFHIQQYCNNFIDTAANEIEARVDYEHFAVVRGRHSAFVRSFPISVAFPGRAEPQGVADRAILERLGIPDGPLGLGVDRMDYTKGILERFKSVEFLLETHPEYLGKFTFLQIASPSRESVEQYRRYAAAVTAEADRINRRFATRAWRPIVLETKNYTHEELRVLYRLADVCMVTSLHDGMNLVAKEFAAARNDEQGTLILSKFTGASRDLKGAVIVNPYSAEETSEALYAGLNMPREEQRRRMAAMRASVRDYNIYRWSAELIKALAQLE